MLKKSCGHLQLIWYLNNSVIQLLIFVVEKISENITLQFFLLTYGFYSGHRCSAKTVLIFATPLKLFWVKVPVCRNYLFFLPIFLDH